MSWNESSAFSAASAFVAFESLMNSTRPSRPTSSMRCARPGNVSNARAMRSARRQAPSRRRRRRPRSARYARREAPALPQDRPRRGFSSRHHAMLADEDIGERRLGSRNRNRAGRGDARLQPRIDFPARLVVHADQRDFRVRDQPLLDRGVAGEIAMPVEMVGRDVDEKADAGRERGRKIDLIGRTLDDMDARRRRAAADREPARRCCRPSRLRVRLP